MSDKKENTGNRNTGYRNTGNSNTGDSNTGNSNTGNRNTGYRNTGYRNTGYRNTGDWNTGYRNTGDWNTGNSNTGYFNTETPTKINVFDILTDRSKWDDCDKPGFIYFNLTAWVCVSNMTDKEKEDNDSYGNAGGYLKTLGYKEQFQKSYNAASDEDRKKVFNIPNFDAAKFFEITGIDVNKGYENDKKKAALIAKAHELLEQAKLM